MEAARSSQEIEKLEEIKFAIIERNGKISILAERINFCRSHASRDLLGTP